MRYLLENKETAERYFRVCPSVPVLCVYVAGLLPSVYELSLQKTFVVLGAGALFCVWRRSVPLLLVMLFGLGWGGLHTRAPWQNYRQWLRRRECCATLSCHVGSVPSETRRGKSALLCVDAIAVDGGWKGCRGKLHGQFPPEVVIRYGDRLQLDGAVLEFEPGAVYATYNRIAGMRQRFVVHRIVEQHPASGWRRTWGCFLEWRNRLESLLTSGIEDRQCTGIYAAMMLGMRSRLDDATRESFVRSATVHIFSISGLHVTLLCGSILFFVRGLGMPMRHCGWLVLPIVLVYVLLSGGAPSALRAYYMALGASLALTRLRRHSLENSLGLSGLLLLLANPLYLLHSGFLFSFTLVATLLRGGELTSGATEVLFERRRWLPMGSLRRRWLNRLRAIASVFIGSLFAWYGSCGLMMHYNCMVSFGALLVNALLAPFAAILVFAFLPKILLGLLWPSLGTFMGRSLQPVLQGLAIICQLGATEGVYRPTPQLGALSTLCYYLLLALALSDARPRCMRLAAFLLLNLLVILHGTAPGRPPMLLAVNGNHSRPPCVAYVPARGRGAILLQTGDRIALRRMMDELKRRGCADRLTLVLADIYSSEWRHELDRANVVEVTGNQKYLDHRRNRAFLQTLRARGVHIRPRDDPPLRNITLENREEGTTLITLPDGTTHLLPQALQPHFLRCEISD